ncbi:MAG TPA: carboxypeptidase-like regulatory domain-containing protein, partial [Nocardioides sp.]
MRAFGRLHHLFAILLATLTGLVASLALGMPAHAVAVGGISGKVTDRQGNPVGDVSVGVAVAGSSTPGAMTRTAADGTYSFSSVPSGSFIVGFNPDATNMRMVWYLDAASPQTATPVQVVEGRTTTDINQTVDLGASIAGTVTGQSGARLGGIRVTAYVQSQPQWPWQSIGSVDTNGDGVYTIPNLQPGTYRLGFTDPTGAHLSEFFDDAATVGTATSITVESGTKVVGKDALLAAASRIAGRVTGQEGQPLQGVNVYAYQELGPNYWSTVGTGVQTAVDGAYVLGGLRAGTYRVGFSV